MSLVTDAGTHAVAKIKNRRTRVIAVLMAVVALFTIFVFAIGSPANTHSQLTFTPLNLQNAPWHVGTLTVATRGTDLVLGLLMVVLALEVFIREPRRGVMARFGFVAVLFLLALLFWAARTPGPSPIEYVNVTSFLVGNIYVVAGPCRWFSPFVVAMGTLQWTCWNTLFLSFMVRLLNIVLYALRRIAALNRLPLSLCLSEK